MANLKINLTDTLERTDPSVYVPQVVAYELGVRDVCQTVLINVEKLF